MKTIQLYLLDAAVLAGLALFVYGLALAWRPLGFIVGGLLVVLLSFFWGYATRRQS